MDFDLRPLRAEELHWCTLDEGGLLIDPVDGRSWSLNAVGLLIWDHCDGTRDIAQITAAIQLSFEIDRVSAHRDLEAFLLSMEDEGLMRLGYPAAS
jgi:hypothetical protein